MDYDSIPLVESHSKLEQKIYPFRDHKLSTQHIRPSIDPPGPEAVTNHNVQQSNKKSGKLDDSFPRFGPIYRQETDRMDDAKKEAWRRVKYGALEEDASKTKEKILASMRRVEQKARETYYQNFSCTSLEFRMMMIRDGCLFIQMAFMILGRSHVELGYPPDDKVFNEKTFKDVRGWMEAMFYVGNQIPLVVLKELVKQKFFQDLIKNCKWDKPRLDLRKRVLYEQLVSEQFGGVEEQPGDVLYVLRSLVLGPPSKHFSADYKFGKYEDQFGDFDLEASIEEVSTEDEKIKFPSASDMRRARVHIVKLPSGWPRSIRFKSYWFLAYLYLPVLPLDANIAAVFRNLKDYEISNKGLGMNNRELCSYVSLLSDIIQTPHDLRILQKKEIIEGHIDYVERIPGILRRLNSKDVCLTYNIRDLRRKIGDFTSPLDRYHTVLNFVAVLTVIQVVFAVLAYFRPP